MEDSMKYMQIWPRDYVPLELIPAEIQTKLATTRGNDFFIQNVPLVEQFSVFSYLWPSPLLGEDNENAENALPLEQPYLLGAQLRYKQEWHLLGHARGELLHSLPLAPGEETTIDVLTWDRNVYKREEEIKQDLEREVRENQTFKDSREVVREIQRTSKFYMSGKGSVNILKIVQINADPGGLSSETVRTAKGSKQTIVEATQTTSSKLHNQRKTSISTTREFGSEERVSRKLSNTNRCHPVTYHFYEILRSYNVSTSLASPAARPCIFVKQQAPISRSELLVEPFEYHAFLKALRWMHYNSHLIARSLLDRSFYSGLEVLPQLVAYWSLRRGLATTGNFDYELQPFVRSLVYGTNEVHLAVLIPWDPSTTGLYSFKQYIENQAPWIFESILTNSNSLANILESNNEGELTQAVDMFLTQFAQHYPVMNQNFKDLFESAHFKHYIHDPLIALKTEFSKLIYGPEPGEEPDPQHLALMKDVAEAMRLMRHIEQNHLHYFQQIWADKDPGQWMIEASNLQLPGSDNNSDRLSDVIEPTLLGFYVDYAVFPYTKATQDSLVAQLVESFLALEDEPATDIDVVLPTNGIVCESQLGESNACEEFIQQHRKHDLELRAHEVEKADLDNRRRNRKLANCELENPECCPSEKYGFFHRLLCKFKGNPD